MDESETAVLIKLLEDKNLKLEETQGELANQKEELMAQKEELTAAIEELMRKNESINEVLLRLQRRNNELDMILYRASHDLKSPVTSIQGLIDLLKIENLTKTQSGIVDHLENSASRMDNVIKSIRMFEQASFQPIGHEPVVLRSTVENVLIELSSLPNYGMIEFKTEYSGDSAPTTDKNAIQTILKCLISNSILHRGKGIAGFVKINMEASTHSLLIRVIDDGEGISRAIEGEIFKMFYRGSEQSRGMGLGLYIVQTLIEKMKGKIDWIRNAGATTFVVQIPLQPE